MIAISGAGGLLGRALIEHLRGRGHEVLRLVRRSPKAPDEAEWSPERGLISEVGGLRAVIHLAGESLAAGRWTTAKKRAIEKSRLDGTRNLVASLLRLETPPRAFLCASAVGYYGEAGDEVCEEGRKAGEGFLAEVCRKWEGAAQGAADAGIRVVNLRFGLVLSARGGALGKMHLPFKMGLGGRLGHGQQWMSWISIEDAIRAIAFSLDQIEVEGPVNVVAPNPVRNVSFAKTLGRALGRPSFLPAPALGLKALLGTEMAQEMLLTSTRVRPRRLIEAGFAFHHPNLDQALNAVLEKNQVGRRAESAP
jgi:uncharacterized protein (TIGR01777 family)